MSLRTKFTLYTSCLILLIILGISYSIFIAQKAMLSEQLEESRDRIFRDFCYTCTEALVVRDEVQVVNAIKSVIKTHNPAIVYTGYISPNDTVFISVRQLNQEPLFKARIFKVNRSVSEDFTSSATDERIREYAQPIYLQGEYRGTIKAGFSQSFLNEEISDGLMTIAGRIAQVSIIALIVGFILANILAFYLNKPIHALAEAADEIGNGNLEHQVVISRRDELGKLGRTFNEMVRKLRELDELKDGFVSSVSHELRSPLAAIDGYCDYLIEGMGKNMAPEKQEKSLKIIKEATLRLTNFINNILDLAKIKAGRFEVKRMPVNINELVREIVSLFETLARQQNKELVAEIPDDLPDADADPEKIKQVITNLIGNALKFTTENGKVTVSARVPAHTAGIVEIGIADTGIGIPRESLQKVFDKFYQVKESEMKKPKGTGLGLAIVAEIVRLHDGRIWAESELGKGSVFKFTLPVWRRT